MLTQDLKVTTDCLDVERKIGASSYKSNVRRITLTASHVRILPFTHLKSPHEPFLWLVVDMARV